MQHAALQGIYFKMLQDEHLPKAWGRYCTLIKARSGHVVPKNELLDMPELMGNIAKNHEDWSVPEPPPLPKKRGMLVLSPEDMPEAKKSIKEKVIKAKDVKNLPPIEKFCEPTTHPPMVEVHSLLDFNANDIPHGKPPGQC